MAWTTGTLMTDKDTKFDIDRISAFEDERREAERGTRRALILSLIAATAFAASALVAVGRPAAMQLHAAPAEAAVSLAYAAPLPERFGAFDSVFAGEEEHALNDAWLGMTVVSRDGVTLGYVADAIISEDGLSDELVIVPADGGPLAAPVSSPIDLAELGAQNVRLSLSATEAVVRLAPATDFDMAGDETELALTAR